MKFGWVGFSGEGVHHEPHIHYENHEALFDLNTISRFIQQKFEPASGIEKPGECPMDAVKYVADHFPYRLLSLLLTFMAVLFIVNKCFMKNIGSYSIQC